MKTFMVILGFICMLVAGWCMADLVVAIQHHNTAGTVAEGAFMALNLICAVLNWKWAAEL